MVGGGGWEVEGIDRYLVDQRRSGRIYNSTSSSRTDEGRWCRTKAQQNIMRFM